MAYGSSFGNNFGDAKINKTFDSIYNASPLTLKRKENSLEKEQKEEMSSNRDDNIEMESSKNKRNDLMNETSGYHQEPDEADRYAMHTETISNNEDYEGDVLKVEGEIVYGDGERNTLEDKKVFGSKDLAELLGVTDQTIRNYCNLYSDFLDVGRKEKGHRVFTKDDYLMLKKIIETKNDKGFNTEQMKDYLRKEAAGADDAGLSPVPQQLNEKFFELAEIITTNLTESLAKKFEDVVQAETRNLKHSIQQYSSTVLEMMQAVTELDSSRTKDMDSIRNRLTEYEKLLRLQRDSIGAITPAITENMSKETSEIRDALLEAMEGKFSAQDRTTLAMITKSIELNKEVFAETLNEHKNSLKNDSSQELAMKITALQQQLEEQSKLVSTLTSEMSRKNNELERAYTELSESKEELMELKKKKKGLFGFFS